MNYLVTGGTGFIGSYVVRSLLLDGDRVVAYDLVPDRETVYAVCGDEDATNLHICAGDVLDFTQLCRIIKDQRIERIIHLAALLGPASQAQPALAVRVNCDGLNNAFEAARLFDLEKVVWLSTSGIFGPASRHGREFVPDDGAHHPLSVYAACKSLNEFMAHRYRDCHGVDNTGLRFGMVYGFGRVRGGTAFGTEIMRSAALGLPYTAPYADSIFDWLHVEDAARAIVLASRGGRTQTRILSAVGDFASVREVVEIVAGYAPDASLSLAPGLLFDEQLAKPDGTGIRQELGFELQYTLREGVYQTMNAYRGQAGLPDL